MPYALCAVLIDLSTFSFKFEESVEEMKNYSPRHISLLFAGIFTVLFFLLGMAIVTGWLMKGILPVLIGSVVIFAGSYFLLLFVLRSFIRNKIYPLYRIVRKSGIGSNDKALYPAGDNPIDEVYGEVDDWARNKITEIAQLKANEKFRKEFIGNVSHELKTPIFNIQGYMLTLMEGGLEDESINRIYLERAEKSVNRMIQIVQDLEQINLIESGELDLNYENFDVVALVEEVFDLNEMRARKKDIDLSVSNKPDKPVMVYADRLRILEVISNLIVNGITYGKQGGWIHVDFMDMDNHLMIEVADNGMGIGEKDQKRIFERFYRVDKSRSKEHGGTGLGLAIVKHFVEAHGHTINLRSERGKGSSFSFTLNKKA